MLTKQRRSTIGERVGPRSFRMLCNWRPAIRGTGVWVEYIAPDWREIRIRLRLSWRTRNYVGTIFGGSMYGALDPFLMLMLMRQLGDRYVVWDKAAAIRFRRPAKRTLRATVRVTADELAELRSDVDERGELDRTWTFDLVDAAGVVHASVDKTVYIATRDAYDAKRRTRGATPSRE